MGAFDNQMIDQDQELIALQTKADIVQSLAFELSQQCRVYRQKYGPFPVTTTDKSRELVSNDGNNK